MTMSTITHTSTAVQHKNAVAQVLIRESEWRSLIARLTPAIDVEQDPAMRASLENQRRSALAAKDIAWLAAN